MRDHAPVAYCYAPGPNLLPPQRPMKANHKQEKPAATPRTFEFAHARPKNLLRVETQGATVRVRAARDNFSPRDKEFFVRHLADEGFIPDRFHWFSVECDGEAQGLEWQVEYALARPDWDLAGIRRRTGSFMVRLLVCSSLLWMVEVGFLLLKGR